MKNQHLIKKEIHYKNKEIWVNTLNYFVTVILEVSIITIDNGETTEDYVSVKCPDNMIINNKNDTSSSILQNMKSYLEITLISQIVKEHNASLKK